MYTTKITGKSIQRSANQFIVDVEFTNGASTFTNKFNFGMDVSFETVKLTIKRYISKLEQAETDVEAITEGTLDLSAVAEPTQTAEEIEEGEWLQKYYRLEQLEKLSSAGILTGAKGTKLADAIATAKTALETGFKVTYLTKL